jgi:parallel beta-helix repeat protein
MRYWRRFGVPVVALSVCAVLGTWLPASTALADTSILYVDQADSNCTDSGSGSQEQPFCTIQPAATKAVAGQTVLISTGTYQESVTVANSGQPASAIVFQAAPGASVSVVGGTHGFAISSKSWVVIQNISVAHTSSDGIYVANSSNITLSSDHVSYAGQPVQGYVARGIRLTGDTNPVVSGCVLDHNSEAGVYLVSGTTGAQIVGNQTFANARQYTRAAPGIDVRTNGNVIANNVSHDNEDSGLQFYPGAADNLVIDNVAYHNGDHGIDNYQATGQEIIGNSVYRNVTAGINLEGSSTGGFLANNISVDNGINSPRTSSNIRVDSTSTTGTSIDYDLVFLHQASTMFIWGSSFYSSLAALTAATGQEVHGVQADPGWAAPDSGDLHLLAGSPGIDSASSGVAGEPPTDADGNPRVDDPATANTGSGPRPYDDRGAYEFQGGGTDAPPSASLQVSPSSGTAPLDVVADASASTDTDATPIDSFLFAFGDGSATVGPQASATANHTYGTYGAFTVTVTVTDTGGQSSTATQSVSVSSANLVLNPGFETDTSGWAAVGTGMVLDRVSGGHSGGWAGVVTSGGGHGVCGLDDTPNWVGSTVPGTYSAVLWARSDGSGATLKLKIGEYQGSTLLGSQQASMKLGTSWQQIAVSYHPLATGSTLSEQAYLSKAPAGTCFYVDDAQIYVS